MKITRILFLFLIAGMIGLSGCNSEDRELKKEAATIAGVMCKTMEAMKMLKTANPDDTVLVEKLQKDYQKIQEEMTTLYDEFRKKYGEKTTSKEFSDKFRKHLNAAMLECKSLSKEDREAFEKGSK